MVDHSLVTDGLATLLICSKIVSLGGKKSVQLIYK